MLRFYTYYSVGGYKDLYLGNSEMDDEFTYLLPLLAIQKKRAETDSDERLLERVKHLDALPKILLVNQASPYGFPKSGARLVSHGGYKLVYTHLEEDSYVLILRDILGENKDESGRSVPFLIMLVADNVQDARKLATIAAFWSNNIDSVSDKIATMLLYDADVNGVKFCLRQFNVFVEYCANRQNYIETVSDRVVVVAEPDMVGALLMSSNLYRKQIVEELGLYDRRIKHIPLEHVLPLDNPQKAAQMRAKAQREAKFGRQKMLYMIAACAVIVGIIVLLFSICR
ncbi:MAG: hypothetical protein IJZ49_00340 [Alistipes sp.]|nr:hypothetical protein [Alistipes sp.]